MHFQCPALEAELCRLDRHSRANQQNRKTRKGATRPCQHPFTRVFCWAQGQMPDTCGQKAPATAGLANQADRKLAIVNEWTLDASQKETGLCHSQRARAVSTWNVRQVHSYMKHHDTTVFSTCPSPRNASKEAPSRLGSAKRRLRFSNHHLKRVLCSSGNLLLSSLAHFGALCIEPCLRSSQTYPSYPQLTLSNRRLHQLGLPPEEESWIQIQPRPKERKRAALASVAMILGFGSGGHLALLACSLRTQTTPNLWNKFGVVRKGSCVRNPI